MIIRAWWKIKPAHKKMRETFKEIHNLAQFDTANHKSVIQKANKLFFKMLLQGYFR